MEDMIVCVRLKYLLEFLYGCGLLLESLQRLMRFKICTTICLERSRPTITQDIITSLEREDYK